MKKIFNIIAITVWTISIGIGTVWITDYSVRPGQTGISPVNLIFESNEENQTKLPRLLMFLHPKCPCSRATLAELNKLVERNADKFEVNIFFYQPSDQPPEWSQTELWQTASEIPNIRLSVINEVELQKFGAITSGQTLLYDAVGNLVFSGGITKARGHEGDNYGSETIEEYLNGKQTTYSETPVFGCILTTSD